MRRVLVIGCSGAGKSTFAGKLAARTGLPNISLDAQFWQPGWVQPEKGAWRDKVARLAACDRWIMDGNFDGTLDQRLPRADTVIWFDYPRWRCLTRLAWRIATTYGQERPEMAAGCREQVDLKFLAYVWNFNRDHVPRIEAALGMHGKHLSPVIFRHDHDATRFLDTASRVA